MGPYIMHKLLENYPQLAPPYIAHFVITVHGLVDFLPLLYYKILKSS